MELMFSIVLLGCTHDRLVCTDYSNPRELYATRSACEQVIPLALHAPNNYPLSIAECVPATELLVDAGDRVDQAFDQVDSDA